MVQDQILAVANDFNELTTSDLQGVVVVKARVIINLVKADVGGLALQSQRSVSQFATPEECATYNQALRDFAASLGRLA